MQTTTHIVSYTGTVHTANKRKYNGLLFDSIHRTDVPKPLKERRKYAYSVLKQLHDMYPDHFIRIRDLNAMTGLYLAKDAVSHRGGPFDQRFPGAIAKNICYPPLITGTGNTKGTNGYYVSVMLNETFLEGVKKLKTTTSRAYSPGGKATGNKKTLKKTLEQSPAGFVEVAKYAKAPVSMLGKVKATTAAITNTAINKTDEQKERAAKVRQEFLNRMSTLETRMDTAVGLIGRLVEMGKIESVNTEHVLDTMKGMRMDMNDIDTRLEFLTKPVVYDTLPQRNHLAEAGIILNGIGAIVLGGAAAAFVYLIW